MFQCAPALDVVQVLDGSYELFNLAKVNTVPCMFTATLSLSWTASRRLNSLAYIESITDAYSQYLVNDIEHTENNKQCQQCKLPREQILVSFCMSSYNCLIISSENTAYKSHS